MSLRSILFIDPLSDATAGEGVQFSDGAVVVKFTEPGTEVVHYSNLEEARSENDHLVFKWADRVQVDKALAQIIEGVAMNYPSAPSDALVTKGSVRQWILDKADAWRSARPITRAVDKWFPPEG